MGPLEDKGQEVGMRSCSSKELGAKGFNLKDKRKGKEKEPESDEDETMS